MQKQHRTNHTTAHVNPDTAMIIKTLIVYLFFFEDTL